MFIKNKIIFFILVLLSLLLAGCFGSPSSVPEDRFYTLSVSPSKTVTEKYKSIIINKIHAYGIYNERAILYARSELPLQIKRYHYHHWVMPPTQLIQNSLKKYLVKSEIASNVVVQAVNTGDSLRISAEILAFERIINKNENSVKVEIEFSVKQSNNQYKNYRYSQTVKAEKDTLHSAAVSYGKALSIIYSKFVKDLQ